MTCPRCAAECPDGAVDCGSCGVVFSKVRARKPETADSPVDEEVGQPGTQGRRPATAPGYVPLRPDPEPPKPPEYLGIPQSGWRAAGIGLAMAGFLTFFPLLSFLLSPLHTIFHELGHTTVDWLFGYPAIPAFDFAEGGGATLGQYERSYAIVIALGLAVGALAWRKRENRTVIAGIAIAVMSYLYAFGNGREFLAIGLGGHAGTTLFAAVFLYRGLTGWGCVHPLEQPLYALLGFKILFAEMALGITLTGNSVEKTLYMMGKSYADADLVRAGQIMNRSIETMGRLVVLFNAGGIALAFWAASIRKSIGALSEAEEAEVDASP